MDTADLLNAIAEQRNSALNTAATVQAQLTYANRRIKELEDKVNNLKRLVPPDAVVQET